jgi:hypothetical protein
MKWFHSLSKHEITCSVSVVVAMWPCCSQKEEEDRVTIFTAYDGTGQMEEQTRIAGQLTETLQGGL